MCAKAIKRLRKRDYFAALMLHSGDADMLFPGVSTHYVEFLRTILEAIGPAPGMRRVSSHHMILLPQNVYFLADCAVNIESTAEELAEIALVTAAKARSLVIVPRAAMLSFSTYGSVNHPFARKVRRATGIAKDHDPDLIIDGGIQLAIALNSGLRHKHFPFCEFEGNANVLIFPDLQSGTLALNLLQHIGEALSVGPILTRKWLPAHLRQYGVTVEEVVNLNTVGVVEAAALRRQ